MTYQEFKSIIQRLAKSQGFYSRLLKRLNFIECNEPYNLKLIEEIVSSLQNEIDVILYLEC